MNTDSGGTHMGAALEQRERPDPVAFYRKYVNPTKRQQSIYDQELLACLISLKNVQALFGGPRIHVAH